MKIRLKNQVTGQLCTAKIGFSWVSLFWGALPCLFRGPYWKGFFVQILASMCTFGISTIVFPFFINKMYINDMLMKNYVAADAESEMALVSAGFIAMPQND